MEKHRQMPAILFAESGEKVNALIMLVLEVFYVCISADLFRYFCKYSCGLITIYTPFCSRAYLFPILCELSCQKFAVYYTVWKFLRVHRISISFWSLLRISSLDLVFWFRNLKFVALYGFTNASILCCYALVLSPLHA